MALTRGVAKDGVPDEAFLYLMSQGGALLASGQFEEARGQLEQAYAISPKNEKALNLLGQTYFKLGVLDRAAEIYEKLVRENPVDPTLRVNLGLVYLKNNATARAVREFQTATDLSPDHRKAQNYLGLAFAQAGEYGRAREHFILAGSDVMAEKMARALEQGGPAQAPSVPEAPPAESGELVYGTETVETVETAAVQPEAKAQNFTVEDEAARYGQFSYASEPPPEAQITELTEPPPSESQLTDPEHPHSLEGDWGSHFGFDPATAPAPHNPFEAPAQVEGEIRFAEDEGPSAPPISIPIHPRVTPPQVDVALEVAAIPEPDAASAPPASFDTIELNETMMLAQETPEPFAEQPVAPESSELFEPSEEMPASPPPPEGDTNSWMSERPQWAVQTDLDQAPAESIPEDAGAAAPSPFLTNEDGVVVTVHEQLLSRCDTLIAMRGSLTFKPVVRHFRGRPLDMPFGEGARQLQRVEGQGSLLLAKGRGLFVPLTLGDQPGYFREDVVYAFEDGLTFENGKVPSELAADVHIVHLSGEGHALLQLEGAMRSVEVHPDAPVTVPLKHWAGWYGNLMPRIVALPGPGEGGKPAAGMELTGEGYALLMAPHG